MKLGVLEWRNNSHCPLWHHNGLSETVTQCVLLLDRLGLFVPCWSPSQLLQHWQAHCCQQFFSSVTKQLLVHVLQALLELKLPPREKALELCQVQNPAILAALPAASKSNMKRNVGVFRRVLFLPLPLKVTFTESEMVDPPWGLHLYGMSRVKEGGSNV